LFGLTAGVAKTRTVGDFMKLVLISAIVASACLVATASPTFAQSTPAEAADIDAAKAAARDTREAVAVPEKTPSTVAVAPAVVAAPVITAPAGARGRPFDSLVASHAASNGIPPEVVHRVILRESRYRADARGRGGASGLMQIKLATARSMGYSGSAAGLLDPDTNLTYGVRYLAGAYRAAHGHPGRALGFYTSGYRGARLPADAYAKAATDAGAEGVVVVRRKRR
jgi:soluble lytic murein transglycosylase-like protein